MKTKYGIDVGNYDTKTTNTTTPSSYKKYSTANLLDEECIFYEDQYYSPTNERNNQQLDKTIDDYCIIISLFAIAKETLYRINSEHPNYTKQQVQEEINNIHEIQLGIGLPAGHFSAYATKTIKLYEQKLQNGFSFTYRKMNDTYQFNLKMTKCTAFPQDFVAVAYNKSIKIPYTYGQYYIAGIGGGTADIIPISNGSPVVENVISLDMGTTYMYAEIIKTIQQESGKTMDYNSVEAVLLDKPTVIDETRKERIFEIARKYINKLVDEMIHRGLKLSDYPCVFIGGGSLLMKKVLLDNPNFVFVEFIEDVRANACYFEEFA